jgi:hypothetical protein
VTEGSKASPQANTEGVDAGWLCDRRQNTEGVDAGWLCDRRQNTEGVQFCVTSGEAGGLSGWEA